LSPARARTSDVAVRAAARALLEEGGLDAVTMQAVADRVGVRAPSLYKRIPSRGALLGDMANDIATELAGAVAPAFAEEDPAAAIRQMGARYRAYAHGNPGAYRLLFVPPTPEAAPSARANEEAASSLLRFTERLVGAERGLDAARLLVAFVHGFVAMELAGAFRLGGDVADAFQRSLDWIVAGLDSPGRVTRAVRSPGAAR
jgi:AcrR family transcriptional regulator